MTSPTFGSCCSGRRFGFGQAWWRAGLAVRIGAIGCAVAASLASHGEDDVVVDDGADTPAEVHGRQAEYDLQESFDLNMFNARTHGNGIQFTNPRPSPQNGKVPTAEPAGHAESQIVAKVRAFVEPQFQQITAMVDLSKPQERKLRLSLESEARRVAEEIDACRQKYLGVILKGQWGADPKQQQLMQQFQKDVQQCRERMRQVCRAGSLLAKTIPTTLDADQQAQLNAVVDGRLDCLWRSIVARQMIRFETSLGLDQGQHEALEALLVEVRPALQHSFGTAPHVLPYADVLVRLAILDIGSERLQTAVSARQSLVLWQYSQQIAGQRQHLESLGVLQKKVG